MSPTSTRADSRRGLTLGHLWVLAALSAPVLVALAGDLVTVDLHYAVRAGNVMFSSGVLLRHDIFTFTIEGAPWVNQQWLGQLALALVYRAGGWELIALARALLVGATFYMIYRACRVGGASRRAGAGLTLAGALVALPQLGARVQLFAILLFALAVLLLANRRKAPVHLWALIPMMVLWVNLHGTFFLLPLLIGLSMLRDRGAPSERNRLLVVGAGTAVASLINPYGVRVWAYLGSVSGDPDVVGSVSEWAPPVIRELPGAFFFISVLVVLIMLARRAEKTDWGLLTSLVFFCTLGMFTQRATIWWALAVPPLLAPWFPARRAEEQEPRNLANIGIASVLVVALLALAPWWREALTGRPLLAEAPQHLTEELRAVARPGERVFNAQLWGSWLELELPDNPIFIDSRIELFPANVWRDYRAISTGRDGWDELLERWDVRFVLANEEQQEHLLPLLHDSEDWNHVASDDNGALFERTIKAR